jgi:hypothetical protein
MNSERHVTINATIDAVARELTSALPSPELRERVAARLGASAAARWLPWAGLISTAGALVFVAFAWNRHDTTTPIRTDQIVARVTTGSAPVNPQASVTGTQRGADSSKPKLSRTTASQRTVAVPASIPALEQPAPIQISNIQPDPLEVRPLVIEPLAIAPLEALDAP